MHHDTTRLIHYVPDLARDRFHVWITKYHYLPITALGLALLAIGGLPLLSVGSFLSYRDRTALHLADKLSYASLGSRRFRTRADSTNHFLIALLTFGEGWHNNHHAFPYSARHGMAWYEIDITWWTIRLLWLMRLADKVRVPSPTLRERLRT